MKPTELQEKVHEGYYDLMSIEMREEIKSYPHCRKRCLYRQDPIEILL